MKSQACKTVLFFLFFTLTIQGSSQRLSVGINLHTPLVSITNFSQNYYNPLQSNRIFFVNEPGSGKEQFRYTSLIFGKMYTGLGLGWGTIFRLNYKRFGLRGGFQFAYQNDIIKLNEFDFGGEIADYKAKFTLQTLRLNFPVLVTIDLKRKINSPFLLIGAEYGFYTFARESIDWDSSYERDYINYLYSIFYNNKPWLYANVGYGKKLKRSDIYFVYKYRADKNVKELSIKRSFMELSYTFYLKDNSLKRKHYIFHGNEK